MKNVFIVLLGIVAVVMVTVIFFMINNEPDYLRLVKDLSTFSDFYIKGDKVYIQCELTIENSSSVDKSFQLNAIFKDDVELGLLKSEDLKGYNQELTNDKFAVKRKTTKTFSVVFVGDFAGINRKHDRNLPEIVITSI